MDHAYLIAEDDENTQLLILRAYKMLDLVFPVHFVNNGQEAIDYLEGEGGYSDRQRFPLPALTISDLKMPRMNGLEALQWIRQSKFREMVVVMFSGSDMDSDVHNAYRAGVNSFVHKPVSFTELMQTLSSIHHYWFGCNFFPINGIAGSGQRRNTGLKVIRERT